MKTSPCQSGAIANWGAVAGDKLRFAPEGVYQLKGYSPGVLFIVLRTRSPMNRAGETAILYFHTGTHELGVELGHETPGNIFTPCKDAVVCMEINGVWPKP